MDLQAIEARLAAATPGPWKAQPFEDEGSPIVGSGHEVGLVAYALRAGAVCDKWYDKPQCEADSEFIAHAPEDIRALIDEVTELREATELVRQSLYASSVIGSTVQHVADMLARLYVDGTAQKLEAVKQLHVVHDCSRAITPCHRFSDGMCSKEHLCEECGRPYPCLTIRALGVTE